MTLSCRVLQVDVWLVDEKNNESMLVSFDKTIFNVVLLQFFSCVVLIFQGGCQISLEDFNMNSPVTFRWFNLLSSTVSISKYFDVLPKV